MRMSKLIREPVTVNLNTLVKVSLTTKGKLVYLKHLETFDEPLEVDKPLTIELWRLMNIFGANLFNGGAELLVDNEVFIFGNGQ
jgi:hypothetical protein